MINTSGTNTIDFEIVISGELPETVTLSTDKLAATKAKSLTIRGANGKNTDKLKISAEKQTRVLYVNTAVPVTVSGIAITGGYMYGSSTSGGGVYVSGSDAAVTLENCDIYGNKAYAYGNNAYGGGIYVYSGTLTLKNCDIHDNTAQVHNETSGSSQTTAYAYGGGIYNAENGTVIMEGGFVRNNTADGYAYNYNAGKSANACGGGIYNAGTFTMKNGTVADNIAKSDGYGKGTYSYSSSCGAGVYMTTGTFSMEGGIVKPNTLKSSGATNPTKKGSGIYFGSGEFRIGGSAKITDTEGIFLASDKIITVTDTLTALVPVSKITMDFYTTGTQVLQAEDSALLASEAYKFAMSNSSYGIDTEGKLATRTAYTITYKDEGDNAFSGNAAGYPTSRALGQTLTLPVAEKAGYVFGGWYLSSDCTGTAVTALTDDNCTANITLYAKWTEKGFRTITYKDAGGGAYTGSNESSLKAKHYLGETETLVAAVKETYVFVGWYTSEDGGTTLADSPVTVLTDENCAADLTLYAKWKAHYTVGYKDSDGTPITTLDATSYYFNAGETKTLEQYAKDGYSFEGWHLSTDNGSTLSKKPVTELTDENCTSDIELYAIWQPRYAISYREIGGGVFTGTATLINYRSAGETVVLPADVKKDGVIFGGWYTSDDDGATLKKQMTVLNDENCTDDIVLFVKWLPYYTITYKNKGGADFVGTFSETPQETYFADDPATLVLLVPERTGYEFLGWYTAPDCSGVPITSLAGFSGDITLYAWWVAPNVSVTIDNGDISITKTEDEQAGTVTLTAKDGYKDYTWTVDGIEPAEAITDAMVSADGKSFTFSTASLHDSHTYFVRVFAYNKNGIPYSTNIQIKK